MKTKQFAVCLLIMGFLVLGWKPAASAQTETKAVAIEGYHDTAWGTLLGDFRSAKNSTIERSLDRLMGTGLDYLLMNFHEVDSSDAARPVKINVEKINGDETHFVFYGKKYCLAAVPIHHSDLDAVKKALDAKYPRKGFKSYDAQWKQTGFGWKMMDYEYAQYEKSPGTLVFLVTASSHYDNNNELGDTQPTYNPDYESGNFLVYVSAGYFNNPENAWADYQSNKNAPEKQKLAQAEKQSQKLQSDLGKIE